LNSAIYTGQLRHRRFAPRAHEFSYPLFMMYVDLSELDEVFRGRWLWSVKRPALARLRRADYLPDCGGNAQGPLDQAVRDRVQFETGSRPRGPIRMLTHLRYFGIGMNPVTFYYCFDRDDTKVETIVAEITNTPWKERHTYVLPLRSSIPTPSPVAGDDCKDAGGRATQGAVAEGGGEGHLVTSEKSALSLTLPHDGGGNKSTNMLRFLFKKQFHVSPFMSMDFNYDWRFSTPGERLTVHMQNMQGDAKVFDATLDIERREITGTSLARTLIAFPCMTATVVIGIYWQALKLWLKRIPFHSHPTSSSKTSTDHEHDARPSSIS
jgi:DUF1365 family protein